MKKLFSVLLILLVLCSAITPCFAETASQMNRYNVVFVTDASGSMTSTDPDKLRFEAIDLFISLLANGGNYVGSVVFGNGIVSSRAPGEVKNKNDKKVLTDELKNLPVNGWTDIGGGIKSALELLESGGNKDIPSIIILLTDGNTEMGTAELTKKSIADKESAMEEARQKGVKIYTISLNKNKTANSDEMKQIANATGGEFREVTNAADLQSVFDLYYQMIYSTQSIKLADEAVPESGIISRDFSVVDLGVEEVNIVIFGDVKTCSLTNPNGESVSDADLQNMMYTGSTFTLIKIPNPMSGVWNLTVEAEPGSTMKIFKIYNSNLKATAEIVNESDSYVKGTPLEIIAKIQENDVEITDTARYAEYQAVLEVTDYDGREIFSQTAETADVDGYHLTFTPSDYGTYYAHITIENEELYADADTFTLNVGNTPPKAKADVIKKHINRWPFLIKTNSTIDLSSAAKDAEDDRLKYKIRSSTWLPEDYTLKDADLTIENFSVSKGSFTVDAYDSLGAYCSFELRVTSTDIGLVAAILIFGGGLLAIAILIFVAWRLSQKLFMGEFEVENLAPPYESATRQKNRGQLKISSLQIGPTGLDKKAHFQATGKNYVYFVSNKPVYNDYTCTKAKKIKIESSMDIRISPTEDYEKGIRVRFESMLNNDF